MLPVKDSTTQDWVGLQGREENNWTAIQFKRALNTGDSLDIPIEVIFVSFHVNSMFNDFFFTRQEQILSYLPMVLLIQTLT